LPKGEPKALAKKKEVRSMKKRRASSTFNFLIPGPPLFLRDTMKR